jgi:hypothetical protein
LSGFCFYHPGRIKVNDEENACFPVFDFFMIATKNIRGIKVCLINPYAETERPLLKISGITKVLNSRPFFYIVLVSIIGIYVYRDYDRVNRDAVNIASLVDNVRMVSERDRKTLFIHFTGNKNILVKDEEQKSVKTVLEVPSLQSCSFENSRLAFVNGAPDKDSQKGDDGQVILKSFLGFRKTLILNPQGRVGEIQPPEKPKP